MPIAALIGTAANLVGGALNQRYSEQAADTSFGRQQALMRLQNQYAVENWERQVSYNDPKAQMQRLKSAGLNPNLVYGSGSAGLESPQIAPPSAPSAPQQVTSPANWQSIFSDAAQAALAIGQAKKAHADTIAANIENAFNQKTFDERVESIALENKWRKEETERVKEAAANLQQQFSVLVADANLKQLDADEKRMRLAKLEDFLDAQLREYRDKHNMSAFEYKQAQLMADDIRRKLKTEADVLDFEFQLSQDYATTDKMFGYLDKILGWISDFVSLRRFFPSGKGKTK